MPDAALAATPGAHVLPLAEIGPLLGSLAGTRHGSAIVREAAVLLVDDHAENLLALEAVLAPTGCRLVSARSGDDALRELLKDDFAVILLDVQMPGLDGFETAELIRARERSRSVPIIFVTAISKEAQSVFRGYETGAVDYLFKPLDAMVLRSKVEVFVESYERGRALAAREELLRATFEDAPIGMARADASSRLRHVNRALCETVGRDPEDLIGRTLDELGPRAEAGIDDERRAQLEAGEITRYEVERKLLGPAGTTIPVLVSASLTSTARGGPPGASDTPDLILHIQDLRERHRAERDREQLIRAQSARAQAEAASERLRLMQSIILAGLGAEDLDGLLREVLERLLEALDVDRAAIVLTDGDEGLVARAAPGVATVVERNRPATPDDVVALVIGERGPVKIGDVPASGVDASSLGPAIGSLLGVPLVSGAQIIGSVHVGSLTRREFDDETIDLLGLAAGRASLAIARTRLYERERGIAQELQRSLLPSQLPAVPGVALAARYEPGGDGAKVGGDWYDAIALPGGRVAVVIGDVVGRGIEAAATMGQMRSALRAILMQADDSGAMAERLNRFALGLGECVLTTVVMAIFEPATGRVRFTNAGHPPPLLVGPDGECALPGGQAVAADGSRRDAALPPAHDRPRARLDAAAVHRRACRAADAGAGRGPGAVARGDGRGGRGRRCRGAVRSCARRDPRRRRAGRRRDDDRAARARAPRRARRAAGRRRPRRPDLDARDTAPLARRSGRRHGRDARHHDGLQRGLPERDRAWLRARRRRLRRRARPRRRPGLGHRPRPRALEGPDGTEP